MVAMNYLPRPEPVRRHRADVGLHSTVAELAGALAAGGDIDDVLSRLTSAAVALIPGADWAKASVIDDGRLRSVGTTTELTELLDRAQREARHGPCLEAIDARRAIRCDDLHTDARWPLFARAAATAGVRSVLCCPVDVAGKTGATLSLFARRANAFSTESDAAGAMLASHASVAFVIDERHRQFKAALETRDVIGQAKGMLMERFGVDAARAFAMLVAISQETNTPVRELAATFVAK